MTHRHIPFSPSMNNFQIASEKKAKGEIVYNFAAGDPVIPNHPAILEMVMEMTKKGFVPYPPVEGIHELREAFSHWMHESCGIRYSADQIAVTCGGKFALFAILSCFLNNDDEVLLIAPYYVSYPGIISILGGKIKVLQSSPEKGWKISPEELERAVTTKTKFLILNNATNPTGILYTKEELHELLLSAKKLGLKVISDEVYSSLVYDTQQPFVSCGSFTEFRDDLFIVQSCSKNFAMSGWRVGFILGNESELSTIKAFQQQTTSGVSLLSQWGALGAITNGRIVNSYVKEQLEKRLSLFTDTFSSLFSYKVKMPSSAIYTFIPLEALGINHKKTSSEAASKILMNQGNIATVPGEAFGIDGYLRFACAEDERLIIEGVQHLHRVIQDGIFPN